MRAIWLTGQALVIAGFIGVTPEAFGVAIGGENVAVQRARGRS